MVDSHAHCHFNAYKDDMNEVILRSLEKGTWMNLVGTQKDTSASAVEVAEKYSSGVYAVVGLHPEHLISDHHDADELPTKIVEKEFDYEFYKKLALHPKTTGIGECGLDLYRIPNGMTREEALETQSKVFRRHIDLAKETNLPLVIHCRDAHTELIEILKQENYNVGVVHCYTSNWEYAEQYLKLGFYIGFTGVITFPPQKKDPKSQAELLEVVKRIPKERMLVETDCPYLSPIPYRGKRGEPWMVESTAQKMADIKEIPLPEVLEITTKNALNLFKKMV